MSVRLWSRCFNQWYHGRYVKQQNNIIVTAWISLNIALLLQIALRLGKFIIYKITTKYCVIKATVQNHYACAQSIFHEYIFSIARVPSISITHCTGPVGAYQLQLKTAQWNFHKKAKKASVHRGRLPITILPNFLSPTLALTTKTKFLLKIRHPLFFYWLIPKGYYFAITNISPWAPANIELNIDRQSSASELGNRSVITELRKSCVLRNQTAKHNRKHALLVDI